MIIISFTIFESGTKACAGEMNDNFSSVMYSVLMNRMENDTSGTTQIDPSIQSDQFCDADGRFNTVCTTYTTSTHINGVYISAKYCRWVLPHTTCCLYTANVACAFVTNTCNYIASNTCGCKICVDCAGYACANQVFNVNYGAANLYNNIKLCGCNSVFLLCPSGTALINVNLNGISCCISRINSYGSTDCNYNVEICRLTANCYELFYNSNSICCIPGTTDICLQLQVMACSCGQNCNYYNIACARILCFLHTTSKIESTQISTNIKDYAIPRNAAMLVTNSVLPSGNSVSYDIKNQAGCTYLANAEPDKVYNLCADDSCCFYAVIKQNITCNLCTPQCMYGYALKMM